MEEFVAVRARALFYNCRRQHLQAVNPTDIDSLLNEHALSSSSSLLSSLQNGPQCHGALCDQAVQHEAPLLLAAMR